MCSTLGVAVVWTPRALAEAEPGPELLAALAGLDVEGLSADDKLYVVEAWEHLTAHVTAGSHQAVARFAGPADPSGREPMRDELAAAMRWSRGVAQTRIDHARQLSDVLPGTLAALQAGVISTRTAAEFIHHTTDLTAEAAAVVEARVLPKAPDLTLADLKERLRRAVARADTRSFAEAHAKAAKGRRVELWPQPDGMATVAATLPAAEAQTVFLALDTVARIPDPPPTDADGGGEAEAAAGGEAEADSEKVDKDGRGIDARRADALVALARGALARPDLPKAHGRKVAVQVVIDLPTLLGLRDNPAELVGYGPLPANVARALAADAAWTRLVVDPVSGHLLDYGTTVYRPPQALQDYVIARDRTCRAPHLPTTRLPLRARPPPALPGWAHQRRQLRAVLQARPPQQDPRRLGRHPQPRQFTDLAHTPGPHLHRRTHRPPTPRRPTRAARPAGTARR
jgi:hypothetical protein